MKYWFYSEGNILGPYTPVELMALPAFGSDSLICSEYTSGDNPGDWRPAQSVTEIAEVMSVGVGGLISSEFSPVSQMVSLETGYSAGVEGLYDFKAYEPGYSYGNILDTIDTVLGTYKGADEAKPGVEDDHELIDRFEVRLSKIQEELEAARWEKNILFEKIRLKDASEKKSQEKVLELETQLKEALEKLEQVQKTGFATEIVKETPVSDKIQESTEKAFPSEAMPQTSPDEPSETIQSRKLKSLGTVRLERIFKDEEAGTPPEISPEAEKIEKQQFEEKKDEKVVSQTQDTDYSFTGTAPSQKTSQSPGIETPVKKIAAETPQPQDDFKYQTIKITPPPPQAAEPPSRIVAPSSPSAGGGVIPPAPGQAQPPSPVPVPAAQGPSAPGEKQQAQAGVSAEPQKMVHEPEKNIPDKTQKIPTAVSKPAEEKTTETGHKDKKINKNKITFIVTLTVFSLIAIGGLGYFFLGGGVGFSEFSLLDFSAKKKETDGQAPTAQAQKLKSPGEQKAPLFVATPSTQTVTEPPVSAKVPSESYLNENVKTALNIVKNYRLGGGRGTISNWFANSFIAVSGSELNEEWTATVLHGNSYVVQYRLLRPRQEPLIYQFEVDIAKSIIVRGINNNAIELLDFPDREKVLKKQLSLKPAPVRQQRKPQKTKKEIPLLPLPDDPVASETEAEPTGFENISPDKDEKVKYIIAQESDEELF